MEQLEFDIVDLGASQVTDGSALWQGTTKVTEDTADVEPLGEGDVYQSLGVSSLPWPATDEGKAEGLCVRGVAGRNTTFIGARDTRSAAIVGNMKPGDTVVHSTGPNQAAQLQLKEEKQQAALVSKNRAGKTMAVIIDGDGDKIQIIGAGTTFEMKGNGDFNISNGRASILLQGDTIALDGNVILGGSKPDTVNKFMISPVLSSVPIPIATTATGHPAGAAKGVFPGA